MKLTPNIAAKGRIIRGAGGVLCLAAALALVFLVPPSGWRRLLVFALVLGGIFGIFQSGAGWCAVRAAGFKTRY